MFKIQKSWIRKRIFLAQKLAKDTIPQIEKDIIDRFQVGGKYSNILIKEELKRIYDNYGYTIKSPKASNINEIFNTKPCKVLNINTNEWEHGLEILGVK